MVTSDDIVRLQMLLAQVKGASKAVQQQVANDNKEFIQRMIDEVYRAHKGLDGYERVIAEAFGFEAPLPN